MKNSRSGQRRTKLLASLTGGAIALALALPAVAQDKEPSAAPPAKPGAGPADGANGPAKGHHHKAKPGAHGPGHKKGGHKKGHKGPKGSPPPKVSPKDAMTHYRAAMEAVESGDKDQAKKALHDLHAARQELRRAHRDHAREILKSKDLAKVKTQLMERSKKLRADRKQRMDKHREELKTKLGEKLQHAPVRAELVRHAWRVARLQRLIAIAEAAGRDKAVERAKSLLEKENAQHPERLTKAKEAKADAVDAQPSKPAPARAAAPVAKPAAPAPAPAPAPEGGE